MDKSILDEVASYVTNDDVVGMTRSTWQALPSFARHISNGVPYVIVQEDGEELLYRVDLGDSTAGQDE